MAKVMERKYKCRNGIIERTRFAVGENTAIRKRFRKAKTPRDKREENKKQAVRELARSFNCNLDETGWFVTLTYSPEQHERLFAGLDEDQIVEASDKQGALFLRRLKRKTGLGLKFWYKSSDREVDENGELVPARIHLHLVIMGATQEQIREAWGKGEILDCQNIYEHQEDYTPLAVYILAQVRDIPNKKKYISSRNLEKPIIEDRVLEGDPNDEIRLQPGAKVLDRLAYREGSVVQYVRYKNKPRVKRGGHKLGTG